MFFSSVGTSRPTLLKELYILDSQERCVFVSGSAGEGRDCVFLRILCNEIVKQMCVFTVKTPSMMNIQTLQMQCVYVL